MKRILPIAVALLATSGQAQDRPGDARRGAQLFEQQRCVVCHSINGIGGNVAPDLARRPTRDYTPSVLAGAIWNHGPAMWSALATRNLPVPRLEPNEVADLFAYFYSLRYFDPPGDAARGKDVLISARCSRCHAQEGGKGPPVSKWRATTDLIEWAQQMWNHSSRMSEEARKAGIPWPQLTLQQMVDLMVYVQNLPGARLSPPTLRVADPGAGQKLFEVQGCARCHTLGGGSAHERIDLLGRTSRFHTLTEFAVAMWNHAPQMRRRAKETESALLPFSDAGMADLLAYLFDGRYFAERGKANRGARIYRKRNCTICHEGNQPGIPQLAQFRGRFSPFFMTSAVWKHGPQMQAELQKRGMDWPTFTNTEMIDLIAYLNR